MVQEEVLHVITFSIQDMKRTGLKGLKPWIWLLWLKLTNGDVVTSHRVRAGVPYRSRHSIKEALNFDFLVHDHLLCHFIFRNVEGALIVRCFKYFYLQADGLRREFLRRFHVDRQQHRELFRFELMTAIIRRPVEIFCYHSEIDLLPLKFPQSPQKICLLSVKLNFPVN